MVTKSKSDLLSRLDDATGKEKIGILNQLAGLYWDLPPNERIAFAEQAIDLSSKCHDRGSKAESLNHLGIAYNNLGDSQKSINYFLSALRIMEQIDDKNGIAISYRNLAQANFYLDNFDKALEYFQKALNLHEEIGNDTDISQSLTLVGNVKAKTAMYDEALDYYGRALAIKEAINDKHGASQIYNNLGNVFLATGHHDKALEYMLKALQIDRELDDKWEIANSTHNLAEQYLKNNEPEKAYPYILESQKLAQHLDNKGLARDNLHHFSLYYELRKDYKKALQYQRDYAELNKSLLSKELAEKIAETQTRYETRKLEELVAERTQDLQQTIYELEQTEKALRESEEKYRSLISNINDLVIEIDSEGKFTYVSPQIFDMFGYTQEEAIGSSVLDFVHPDDIEKYMNAMEILDEVKQLEYRSRHKDGHYVHVSTSGRYIADEAGGFKIVSVLRDITERVRLGLELQEAHAFAENIINTAPVIMLVLDTEGKIVRFNPYLEELSGYSLEEAKGADWFSMFLPQEIATEMRTLFGRASSDKPTKGNVHAIVTKDGRKLEIEWYGNILTDSKGNTVGAAAQASPEGRSRWPLGGRGGSRYE